jgi:hypothetical protein
MDLREIGCEDGRWMELAQDRVQWRTVVLAVFNLRVLLLLVQLGRVSIEKYKGVVIKRGKEPCKF